jgi:hypothetical protein
MATANRPDRARQHELRMESLRRDRAKYVQICVRCGMSLDEAVFDFEQMLIELDSPLIVPE